MLRVKPKSVLIMPATKNLKPVKDLYSLKSDLIIIRTTYHNLFNLYILAYSSQTFFDESHLSQDQNGAKMSP